MKLKKALGLLLVLHGLAHTSLGMAAQDDPHHGLARLLPAAVSAFVATTLFLVVTPGFVAAGFGAWGVPGLRRVWGSLVKVAVLASFAMLAFTAPSALRVVFALVLDLAVLAFADLLSEDAEPTPPSRRAAS